MKSAPSDFVRRYVFAFKPPADRAVILFLTHNHRWSRDFEHAGMFSDQDLASMKEWLVATNNSPGHAISGCNIVTRQVICKVDPFYAGDLINDTETDSV